MTDERITLGEILDLRRDGLVSKRGRDFVEENRAGIMSAFVKAMRMQRWRHAVYYGSLLLIGGQNTWYVGRRVVISAAEDSLDPNVMRYAAEMHVKKSREKSFEDVLLGAVAVCSGVTWWNTDYGRRAMFGLFKEKKYEEPKTDKLSELVEIVEDLIMRGGWEEFIKSTKAVYKLTDDKRELYQDWNSYHRWLIKACLEKAKVVEDGGLTQAAEALKKVVKDVVGYNDGNWEWALRYMACVGSPEVPSYEDFVSGIEAKKKVIKAIMSAAKQRLKSLEVVIPPWAYDGVHASNKRLYWWGDKRFAGTNQGMYNCLKQVKKYGRLDPRDQAELEGCEVPKEGLVLCNEFLDTIGED